MNLHSVRPHYAVKCNPEPKLIHLMREALAGFDCASQRELSIMNSKGHFRDSIIYANPCKSERDIEYAKEMGHPLTVVDSIEEVEKLHLKKYEGGALIRIKVDDSESAMPFGAKFGATDGAVAKIGLEALRLGIALKGISFHVGSGCFSSRAHYNAILNAVKHCGTLKKQGHPVKMVDIGGGFLPDRDDFAMKTASIREAMYKSSKSDLEFIAEPGRFFATDSHDLFVQVIGKKEGTNGWRYTLDESLYGQFTNILFDHQTPRWVRISNSDTEKRKWGPGILFGRTCDSLDVIARSESMEELEVGDWLWFPSMGAYTTATASEFNGFPKPPTFIDIEEELPILGSIPMNTSVDKIEYVKHVSAESMLR
jgi:ornithine decarboxylase